MSDPVSPLSPSRPTRRRRLGLAGALVVMVAFAGVACGDDDDGPTEAKADFADYCEKSFALETYFANDPDVDFETATPEQIQAAVATYLQGAKPLVDAVVPVVPADIKDSIDVQVRAFNQALGGADPEAVFETPEVSAAEAESHSFDVDNCGWGQIEVTATEYSFAGLPSEIDAGRTSIDLTNDGKELHEIVFISKNPGVTESFDEILALPEEEGMSKATPASFTFASPGDEEYSVVDLPAGEYLAVCFIPQGLTSEDGPPPAEDAKPHFALGMKKEVTVK